MEFTGRIKQVLPMRSGVSQRTGKEWKTLPFIFEYFEHPTDRYSDQVVLETFDTNQIEQIKENLPVRIGFGHKTREYNGNFYNELRMYMFQVVGAEQPDAAASGTGTSAPQQTQQAPQQEQQPTQQGETQDNDPLPF